jgi:hypothetical protein
VLTTHRGDVAGQRKLMSYAVAISAMVASCSRLSAR